MIFIGSDPLKKTYHQNPSSQQKNPFRDNATRDGAQVVQLITSTIYTFSDLQLWSLAVTDSDYVLEVGWCRWKHKEVRHSRGLSILAKSIRLLEKSHFFGLCFTRTDKHFRLQMDWKVLGNKGNFHTFSPG